MSGLKRSRVPEVRVRAINDRPVAADGEFVLYWMNAYRRTTDNFALDRAIEWAKALERPLLVLEALRVAYPWASDRLHAFVLQGMRANAAALASGPVRYHPYVEPTPGAGKGLLAALGARASVVVTDFFPTYFLPRAVAAAARQVPVLLEQVDSAGLLPVRAAAEAFKTAHAFRRFLQKVLPDHLASMPQARPLSRLELPVLPDRALAQGGIARRWPAAEPELLAATSEALAALPIDHEVGVVSARGGADAGREVLEGFLDERLGRYDEARNQPEAEATSGLSPYLHFGHVSIHAVLRALIDREGWSPTRLSPDALGEREGWWGFSGAAEAFLDEAVTWRELGFNCCATRPDHDRYESLPEWARATLEAHAGDPREHVYSLAQFEAAETHDELWNAAQRELRTEGRIHNYLRMLWGKKILEWSAHPRDALRIMIELNNKYAVDGRDPNSYTGIFWVLGRYDRPWAPERPIFGRVRYMSSDNTRRKFRVTKYLSAYGRQQTLALHGAQETPSGH